MKTKEYMEGKLSTDFLARFKVLDKLKSDIKKDMIEKQDAALAAAALYSTYYSSTIKAIPESSTHWKSKLDRA